MIKKAQGKKDNKSHTGFEPAIVMYIIWYTVPDLTETFCHYMGEDLKISPSPKNSNRIIFGKDYSSLNCNLPKFDSKVTMVAYTIYKYQGVFTVSQSFLPSLRSIVLFGKVSQSNIFSVCSSS